MWTTETCTCGKRTPNQTKLKEAPTEVNIDKTPKVNIDLRSTSDISIASTKTSQTEEDSGPIDSDTSASTEESFKTSAVFSPDASESVKSKSPTRTTEIEELNEEVNEKCSVKEEHEEASETAKEQAKAFSKRKCKPNSNVFRNLLNCGAVETNDAAVMLVNKSGPNCNYSPLQNSGQICKYDTFGGSERKFNGASWNQQQAHFAR